MLIMTPPPFPLCPLPLQVCTEPQLLVEVFVNYDCDLQVGPMRSCHLTPWGIFIR